MYKTYKPEGVSDPYGTYVHAIEPPANSRMVFLSGQIPVKPDGSVPHGMEAQATVCWQNIEAILKSAGLGIQNLVRTTQYLTDPTLYPQANKVRAKFLDGHRTASVAITVPALIEPDWLIEIDAIAMAPGWRRAITGMINVPCVGSRTFSFDPRRTAFISVDMQHDFVSDQGACGVAGMNMTAVQAVIPRLQNVLSSMRSAGAVVVHTRYGFKPDLSNLPESVRQQSRDAGGEYGTPGPMGRILVDGEKGFEIIPEMMPRSEELVIDKATFGAFTDTDLHRYLQSREITHLIIGGVTTQCCVEGTLREAVDRGYFCLTLNDGSGAFEAEHHEGTMRAIQSEGHLFGWIANCDDVVAAIREVANAV